MVAVVSGNGLGLNASSLAALGSSGGLGSAALGQNGQRIFVNSATGNLIIQGQDEDLASLGADLRLIRTYNSQGHLNDDNADNWRLGIDEKLYGLTGTVNTAGSTIVKVFGDGAEALYTYDTTQGMYVSTDGAGAHDTLAYNAGTQLWTWTEGSSRRSEGYDVDGRLISASGADGNETTYIYTGTQLTQITDASGQVTYLDYTDSNLTQIRVIIGSQTQTRTLYSYDYQNRLTQVTVDLSPEDNDTTDANTYVTTYYYDGSSNRIASIYQSDGNSISFTYEELYGLYRVKTYTDALNHVTTLNYTEFAGGVSATADADTDVLSTTESQTTYESHDLDVNALSTESTTNVLQNGIPVTGVSSTTGTWKYYTVEVPAGMSELFIRTQGGTGNADVFARLGVDPTTTAYDATSQTSTTTSEGILIQNPAAGTWHIGVRAVSTLTNTTVLASFQSGTLTTQYLTPGDAVNDINGRASTSRAFQFYIPPGSASFRLELSGTSGNSDLYLSPGAPVDVPNAPYSSKGSGSNEVLTVNSPTDGYWYALVLGVDPFSDAKLIVHTDLGSNARPIVEAGAPQTVSVAANVTLQATASDAEGAVTYQWSQIEGPSVSLDDYSSATVHFTAPGALGPTLLRFQVRVTDSNGVTNTDIVRVLVNAPLKSYAVQTGDTWSSIALALYGTADAASLLQTALGNPPLTAGTRLRFPPSNLSVPVTTNTTVPAYYVVQGGDTWASVTQAIYGTNDFGAAAALQATLGSPQIYSGLHLTVPLTLAYHSMAESAAAVDSGALATTEDQTIWADYPRNSGALTTPAQAWLGSALLESSATAATDPKIAFDSNGNGFAVWAQGNDLFARRYDKASNTWGTQVTLDSRNNAASIPALAVDAQGNALVAWVQSNGTANSTYANQYDASSQTWGTAQLLETATQAVATAAGALSASINGGYGAVAWLQTNGTQNDLYVARLAWGTWNARELVESSTNAAAQPSIAADAEGNVSVLWQQSDGTAASIYANRYSASGASWSGASLLESSSTAANDPRIVFNSDGNGFAVWRQGNDIFARYYDKASNTWLAQTTLDSRTVAVSNTSVAIDSQGNALSGWVQSDGTAASTYVSRYDRPTDNPSTASLVEFASQAVATAIDAVSVALNGSFAAVAWLQTNGTQNDLYVSRYIAGNWMAPELIESNTNAAAQPVIAIDALGNVGVVWKQSDGTANSIYANRYNNDVTPYYLVQAGDTWNSIAQTLYGSTATAATLEGTYGSPTLTAGLRLLNPPASIYASTTSTVTVAPYYTVQVDDTWESITLALYGTSDPEAVAALQDVLRNPYIYQGVHLAVPAVLSYGHPDIVVASDTEIETPLGFITTLENDEQGRLTGVKSPAVGSSQRETQYQYDADGNVTGIVEDAQGLNRVTALEYDAAGNLTLTRDALGNTITRTYNAANQVLTETRYRMPDPDGAGSGVPSAPMTSRFAYDAEQHLRFAISAEGRVTEHRYDADGNLTATLSYRDGHYDVSALSVTTALSESQLNTWASGQDLTQLERTDFAYDFRGNVSDATRYSATDVNGEGVTSSAAVTHYIYDQRGRLLQRIDPRGVATPTADDFATTYTYDGLDRLLSATQWTAQGTVQTALYQYDAAGHSATVTLANGLATTSVFDTTGRLLSQSQTDGAQALGTTNYAYDTDGRLRKVTDPTGVSRHPVYDDAGRKIFDVEGDGSLTEYVYNSNDDVVKTIQYAAAADTALLADLYGTPLDTVDVAALRTSASANPSQNRITRSVYDEADRLVYSIDADGAVTELRYDGASRLTDSITYGNRVTISSSIAELLPGDVNALLTTSSADRRTRQFYDGDGNAIATLDAAGYLVENVYDDAGQLARMIGYAAATPVGQRASGTLAALRPSADAAHDVVSRFFYDAQGRRVGVLDSESYLTETVYDETGNIAQTIRYDSQRTYTTGDTLDDLRPATLGDAQVSSFEYDAFNRLVQDTNYEGTVTQYQYDDVGNLIGSTKALSTADERTRQTRYDALGRITAELTAEGSAQITGGMTQVEIDAIWDQYSVRHTYDLAGRRTSTTDQNGNKTVFYYDTDGRLTHTVNALGEVREQRYNALNELVETIAYGTPIYPSGFTGGLVDTYFTGLVAAVADPNKDSRTTLEYTATGRVETTTTAEGATIMRTYDAFGDEVMRTEEIDATHSLEHDYAYDARGRLTSTHWDPSGLNTSQTNEYDAFGRLIRTTDPNGNISERTYDRLGQVIETRDPLNGERATTYDAFSRTLTMTDALGNTTEYAYDDAARSVVVTTPEGVSFSTVHNRHGQTVTVTDGRGAETSFDYDANGQLLESSDSLGTLAEQTYDRAGRLIDSIDANGLITRLMYDAANRVLTRSVDPDGLNFITTYGFDGKGQVIDVTDANGIVTHTEYDRDGRVAAVTTDPTGLNIRTEYEYDLRGAVTRVTEGVGSATPRVTAYVYDALDRRTSEVVDPGSGKLNLTTAYQYDKNSNVIRKTDANNHATRYVYDANDRLRYTIDALGGVTETTYDAENRLSGTRRYATAINTGSLPSGAATPAQVQALIQTSVRDRLQQSVYDREGREVFSVDALGGVTKKEYDGNGNVVREYLYSEQIAAATYSTPQAVINALAAVSDSNTANDREQRTVYDARNRASFSLDGLGGVVRTVYDAGGRVTARTVFATLRAGSDLPSLATMESWVTAHADANRDHTSKTWYDAANRPVFSLDAEGVLSETRYDDVGRVTDEFVYFNAPSLSSGATLEDVEQAIVPSAAHDQRTQHAYDHAGRQVSTTDAVGNTESYTFDAVSNRLTFTNEKNATWTYVYDANRRLIEEHSPQVAVTTIGESGGNLTSATANASIVTRMAYDAVGNVTSRTEAYGRAEARTTTYVYDVLGRQTRTNFPSLSVYNAAADDLEDVGTAVVRTESSVSPYSEVTYDTLGNAVLNRDVAGNFTHQSYDKLGRLQYAVDAEHYVTEHRYDTFGNESELIRYAGKLTLGALTDSSAWTSSEISSRITANSGQDRTIQTSYDRLNRAVQVTQPAVMNFEPASNASGGTTFTAGATTLTEYDAFGQAVRSRRLVNSNTSQYADTYFYYDRRGLKSAEVDALGQLTTFEYDETGDLTEQLEYAKALTSGQWSITSHNTPATTTPANSPNDPAGYDRKTVYDYDRLNHKISETRVGIQYSEVSGSTISLLVGDQTTTFGYDAVGNQTRITDENGAASYAYYDVLGRQIATAAPSRDRGDGTTLRPLTLLRRDVFGNLVEQLSYANSATAATETTFTAGSTSADDRTNRLQLDGYGHALRSQDGVGSNRYASYDVKGQLAKEWQPVTDNDSNVDALVTAFEYDRLGRQTAVIEPQILPRNGSDPTPAVVVRTESAFNAFGEIISRGTDGGAQEYFDYDQAGRLWRTNSGDGVDKVYLYNLAGQATAEIRSQTLNLKSYSMVSSVAALTDQRMRTEIRYDLLGRVVEQREPRFTQVNPDGELQAIGAQLHVNNNILGPSNPNAVYRQINLGFNSGLFGQGSVLQILDPSATVAQGGGHYYVPPSQLNPYGGGLGTGWGLDSTYHLVSSRYVHWARPAGYATLFGQPDVTAKFEYRLAGNPNGAWTTKQVAALPNNELGVDVGALASGQYEYRLTYAHANELTAYAIATGDLSISGSSVSLSDTTAATLAAENITPTTITVQTPINGEFKDADFEIGDPEAQGIDPYVYKRVVTGVLVDYVVDRDATVAQGGGYYLTATGYVQDTNYTPASSRYIHWNEPADSTLVATFEYRLATGASASWTTISVTALDNDQLGVAIGNLASGRYEFRVTYTHTGSSNPVATASGTFGIEAVTTTNSLGINADPPDDAGFIRPITHARIGGVSAQIIDTKEPYEIGDNLFVADGENDVLVTFPPVEGEILIELEYETLPYRRYYSDYSQDPAPGIAIQEGVSRKLSVVVSDGSTGVAHVTWQDDVFDYWYTPNTGGGVDRVTNVRVYKGLDSLEYATDGNPPSSTLSWVAPVSPGVTATLNIRAGGTEDWQSVTPERIGAYYTLDTSQLAHGSWDYEVTYTRNGDMTAKSNGQFSIAGGLVYASPGGSTIAPISGFDTAPVEIGTVTSAGQSVVGPIYEVQDEPFHTTWDIGNNVVPLSWPALGSGPVRVVLDYMSNFSQYNYMYGVSSNGYDRGWTAPSGGLPGVSQQRTFQFSSASTGVSLTWDDPDDSQIGGIGSVERVRVYTQDGSGNWVLQYDRDGAVYQTGKSLQWQAAEAYDDPLFSAVFKIREHGSNDAWEELDFVTTQFDRVDLDAFASGEYDYELSYLYDGAVTDSAAGVLTVIDTATGGMIGVTQTNLKLTDGPGDLGPVGGAGTTISWSQAPVTGDSIVVRYRHEGDTTWIEDTVSGSGPDFSWDLSDAGVGATEFEVLYTHALESEPYAQVKGLLNKTLPLVISRAPNVGVTQTAIFTSLAPVTGLTNTGNVLSWTNALELNTTVKFRYQIEGGDWQEFTPVAHGAGFQVDQRVLPPGSYEYEISYSRPGENVPYVWGSGTMTVGRQTTGGAVSLVDNTSFFLTSTEEIDPSVPSRHQTLDRWGNVLSVTSALNDTTNYRYNSFSELIETKLPQISVTATAGGTVTASTVRPVTENHYDLLGRLIATRDANGNVNRATYNAAGQVIRETHADGGERDFIYNTFGEQREVIDELNFRTRNTYDRVGQLTLAEHEIAVNAFANNNTAAVLTDTYVYDAAGRRIRETNGEGETTKYWYDLQDNVVRRRTPRGFESSFEYDTQGRKTREIDANGESATWNYDYFGRATEHTDLGGATSQYAYDEAGELVRQTNSMGQDLTYAYDEAGHLTRITDRGSPASGSGLIASNRVSEYGYDLAGQRVLERTTVDGRVQQNTRMAYDATGRMVELTDPNYHLNYSYDAAGNRTHIEADYYNHDGYGVGNAQTQNLWYTYDSMNRVLVSQGANTAGSIAISAAQGVELTYNLKGERKTARTYGEKYQLQSGNYSTPAGYTTEAYDYDGSGRLLTTTKDGIQISEKTYDKASRELTDTRHSIEDGTPSYLLTVHSTSNTYDDDGRVTQQVARKNGALESIVTYGDAVFVPEHEVEIESPFGGGLFHYTMPAHWQGPGYDAAGVLRGYSVEVFKVDGAHQYNTDYTLSYRLGETYQQTGESAASRNPGRKVTLPTSGSTARTYNVNGELVQVTDSKDATQNRYFANNAQGQTLAAVEGNYDGQSGRLTVAQAFENAHARTGNQVKGQYFFFANGQSVGSFGQLESGGSFKANFDVNYQAISERYPPQVPAQLIVQAGDTLRGLAARVFGDANLWYLLAEANGLTNPDVGLEEGTQLKVPNEVVSFSNTATSFKPFDVTQALGDTTPAQPMPPPRKKKGCGVVGQIIVIIVAVVVAYYTGVNVQGALAGSSGAGAGAGAGAAAGAGAGAAATTTGAVIGAAAGSIVSQVVAIAIGQQDKFSWKGVAAAALSGGLAPGVSSATSGWGAAATAAVNNVVSQGVNIALGLQERFSWAAVAASAVAAPIARQVAPKVAGAISREFSSKAAGEFAGRLAGGLVQQVASVAFNGGRIDYANLVADAFGNALGNSIVSGMTPKPIGVTAEQFAEVAAEMDARTNGLMERTGSQAYADAGRTLDQMEFEHRLDERIQLSAQAMNDKLDMQIQASVKAPPQIRFESETNEMTAAQARGLAYFDKQLARSLNGPSGVVPMAGGALAEMDHSSYVAPGFVASAYYSAAAEAENGNNSLGTRAINLGLAVATAPLALAEEAGRAILNIPYGAQRVGQDLAIVNLSSDRDTQILAGLDAVSFGAQAFTAAGSVVPIGQAANAFGAANLAPLQSAESFAAARATYAPNQPGLRTSTVISAERAEGYLIENGFSPARAKDYVASFDGPITARIARPGEAGYRYTDIADSQGNFLTQSEFATPPDAVSGLYLRPEYQNNATLRQTVTATGRSIVLEGAVRNGGPGVQQTVVINRNTFNYGTGVGY